MQETTTLQATVRERLGSRYSKRIRESGQLPAIVYGHGENPMPIALDAREALSHFHHGHKVFKLELAGDGSGEPHYVLLKDLQFDHLGTNVIHCDFARVDLNERVETRVPIHLIGEAKGLGTAGAIMMHPNESIEIECVLTNIPEFIEVDVSGMQVGEIMHARDIKLPLASMKLISDGDAIIAQIVVQSEEAEGAGEEAQVSAEGAEPEVVGRKAKEEEGGED